VGEDPRSRLARILELEKGSDFLRDVRHVRAPTRFPVERGHGLTGREKVRGTIR
jgi:hypothetical protein